MDPELKELTPDAQSERDNFVEHYGNGGCTCFKGHPPCSSCTHPGNPRNQEEDETAWQPVAYDPFHL